MVYRAFQEALSEDYITAEELLGVLCRVADASGYIKKSTIVLDGFTGFTPVQYQLLQVLMACARHIACTVTVGREVYPPGTGKKGAADWGISSQECGLFHMSYQMTEKLRLLAEEAGCPCKESYHLFIRKRKSGHPCWHFWSGMYTATLPDLGWDALPGHFHPSGKKSVGGSGLSSGRGAAPGAGRGL